MENRHQSTYVRIGLNILYYRKLRGYTQLKLAELTNFSRNHVQRIESAATMPSVDALLDIAEALEIPIGKLFESR